MNGLKLFMEQNPDIEVEYIAGRVEEHHTKLLTMMAGGAAPMYSSSQQSPSTETFKNAMSFMT